MPAINEAAGMALAMEKTGLPYIISFMIRDNGKLMDGTSINDAIYQIDKTVKRKPLCYITNCIHPKVLYKALDKEFNKTELVRERFKGIQANTSELPPEVLDDSTVLVCSDCNSLAEDIIELNELVNIKIYGGCCGTDDTHIRAIVNKIKEKQYGNDCLFCKIIDGEIPSTKVYEDENVYAFKDIDPKAPVHVLIVPKKHIISVAETDETDMGIYAHIMSVAKKLANDLGLENGYRLVANTGRDGGQAVAHLHIHLLGGRTMLWPPG